MERILPTIFCIAFSWTIYGQAHHISIIQDVTDPSIPMCGLDDIQELLPKDKVPWDEIVVRIRVVSDVHYGDRYEMRLPGEHKLLGNRYKRLKKLKNFYVEIDSVLGEVRDYVQERSQSFIYTAIAEELNYHARSAAQHRYVAVFSNLLENNRLLNLYDNDILSAIERDDIAVWGKLSQRTTIENITGVHVYLVHRPTSAIENWRFGIASNFYGKHLRERGGTISITSNVVKTE